jgi:hypothetical protein
MLKKKRGGRDASKGLRDTGAISGVSYGSLFAII